jgi:hypothetical protein
MWTNPGSGCHPGHAAPWGRAVAGGQPRGDRAAARCHEGAPGGAVISVPRVCFVWRTTNNICRAREKDFTAHL